MLKFFQKEDYFSGFKFMILILKKVSQIKLTLPSEVWVLYYFSAGV